MKAKTLVPVITSVFLTIVLVVMACTQAVAPKATTPTPAQQSTTTTTPIATPTSTPTPITQIVEKDKSYNVINPTGIFKPVQTQGLAPRLNTIDGKTIWVDGGEADPVIWPALIERLKKDYPKTTWVYLVVSTYGPAAPEDEVLGKVAGKNKADAVIRGNGW